MDPNALNNPALINLATQTVHALDEVNIIGRHEDCNLVLKSERGASRKHARILLENNNAILMDLGSLNGTLVNGREIGRAVQLIDGDIIIFDQQEYRFVQGTLPAAQNSENLTVVANKDEANHPDQIKPAIRVLDEPIQEPASFDETEATEIPPIANQNNSGNANSEPALHSASESAPELNQQPQTLHDPLQKPANEPIKQAIPEPVARATASTNDSQFDTAIPATSRPGGDAPTPRRLQNKYYEDQAHAGKKKGRLRYAIIIPLIILLLLVAIYFAYNAGLTTGAAGSNSG